MTPGIMLQKYIARSGKYSRRQAEELIRAGNVSINKTQAKPGDRVFNTDKVRVGKELVEAQGGEIYLIMNKPRNYVCTNRKFKGEKNIFELLQTGAGGHSRLKVAGRLDKESRGLILLTSDGELIQELTHPRYGHEKEYIVEVKSQKSRYCRILGKRDPANSLCVAGSKVKSNKVAELLKKGIDIREGDGVVRAKEADYLGGDSFRIVLAEGKKRQIRRMFKALDYEVEDLARVRIANIKIDGLKEGFFRELNENEIKSLKDTAL